FYYSGHAKANAFSLGENELAIATLREKLRAIPSTLTLVVLDACQSGQFARTKGTEPAADFSFNSVSRLTTKGIAVMASSSAQELSQESDELRSSYFTHHLVVGLRGAADADGDGRVSLDEAYRYAYRRTLASTAQTQVGGQHVTLETDLAGQGEVPVTYPADARSQLELPGPPEAGAIEPVAGVPLDPWTLDVGVGFMGRVDDEYTRRLADFGYEPQRGLVEFPRGKGFVQVSRGLFPHLALGLQLSTLSGDTWK